MTPFECPSCKRETRKLIAMVNGSGIGCPSCYETTVMRPTYLHQLAEGSKGDKNFTVAKDMMINRRILSPDKKTAIDRTTGRPSQY